LEMVDGGGGVTDSIATIMKHLEMVDGGGGVTDRKLVSKL